MKTIFVAAIFTALGFNSLPAAAWDDDHSRLEEIPISTSTVLITDSTPTYELSFYLDEWKVYKARSAAVEFVIVGVCCGSRVVINGRPYHLNDSEDLYAWWDSLGKTVIPIPTGALIFGLNTIVFEAAVFNSSTSGGNLNDDFQFRDVSLVLSY